MSNRSATNVKGNRIRGLKRKLLLIEKSGGECLRCGYKKNLSALQFHHVDASIKSFSLNQKTLSGKPLKELLIEYKKCDLLCANCHFEHHSPTSEINQVKEEITQHEKNRVKNTTRDFSMVLEQSLLTIEPESRMDLPRTE
jgi:hypothetical protein